MNAVNSWRLAVLAAALVSGAAQGAVVHRCRLADGSIAYSDRGCAVGEVQIDRREFADAAPAAPASATPEAPTRRTPRYTQARAGPARAAARPDRIVANECRFGEQRWVQAEACPRTFAAAAPRGGKATKHGVDETRLAASQVCRALRDTSAAQAPGDGSARRGYAMNRLRQLHGC